MKIRLRPLFAAALLIILSVIGAFAIAQGSIEAEVVPMDAVLRLRAAPSTESAILDLLEPGTPLDLIGRTPDSRWLAIRTTDGKVGWVWSLYVNVYIDLNGVCVVGEASLLAACADFAADTTINILETFQRGQALGNQANIFAKVGDSITVSDHFLVPIGAGSYNLGSFTELQPVIDFFSSGRVFGVNPFMRRSLAAEIGWAAPSVLDPNNANPAQCLAGESPLACEYRLIRPSIALIMFGTNDVGYMEPAVYQFNLERIVQISLQNGVIPVLSTIPDRLDMPNRVQIFNGIVSTVASEQRVPLWDFYSATVTLPSRGLTFDGVHPSSGPRGYDSAADFRTENLAYGYVVRNLTALQMLNAIWRITQ